jgi:hypothetical protein
MILSGNFSSVLFVGLRATWVKLLRPSSDSDFLPLSRASYRVPSKLANPVSISMMPRHLHLTKYWHENVVSWHVVSPRSERHQTCIFHADKSTSQSKWGFETSINGVAWFVVISSLKNTAQLMKLRSMLMIFFKVSWRVSAFIHKLGSLSLLERT